MRGNIWLALGLVLVFEGLTYALVPRHMQKMMQMMQSQTPEQLRVMGTVVLAFGVFVVWLAV
jgi:uncharacterized protein